LTHAFEREEQCKRDDLAGIQCGLGCFGSSRRISSTRIYKPMIQSSVDIRRSFLLMSEHPQHGHRMSLSPSARFAQCLERGYPPRSRVPIRSVVLPPTRQCMPDPTAGGRCAQAVSDT
jgi:hypothetical protein